MTPARDGAGLARLVHTQGGSQWVFIKPAATASVLRPPGVTAFEIRETESAGLGAFATRDIQLGERLIAEAPLALWSVPLGGAATASGHAAELTKVIDRLAPAQREAFLSLSQTPMHGATKSIAGTWLTNALPIEDEAADDGREAAAVFATISRLNHACSPNCHREWNSRLSKLTVHAQRAITLSLIHI